MSCLIRSTEPESSDDELDTEDGEVNIPQSAGTTRRARGGHTEATRDPPLSAPASTSTNAIVRDNFRSQMKRKEFESLFISKKRVRYTSEAHSDQDHVMDIDLDEPAKSKRERYTGENNKQAPGIFLVHLLEDIS